MKATSPLQIVDDQPTELYAPLHRVIPSRSEPGTYRRVDFLPTGLVVGCTCPRWKEGHRVCAHMCDVAAMTAICSCGAVRVMDLVCYGAGWAPAFEPCANEDPDGKPHSRTRCFLAVVDVDTLGAAA